MDSTQLSTVTVEAGQELVVVEPAPEPERPLKEKAIIAAVQLSERYITDRFLPDKAIDLVDEAAAKLKLEIDSVPQALDDITRRIAQKEIEREAIKREGDKAHVEEIEKELAQMREEEKEYAAKWRTEKDLIDRIQQNKVDIEKLNFEASKAEREGDYARVAEIRYSKVQEKERENAEIQEQLKMMQGEKALIKEEVDAEDIADIVQKTVAEIYPKYYPPEVADFFRKLHGCQNIAGDIQKGRVYVLRDNDIIVGTGSYEKQHITRVYVLPRYQGRGYGGYILKELEK